MYESVPAKWKWLTKIQGLPAIVAEGLKEYGRLEGVGTSNNPTIVNWADEIARKYKTNYANWAADWYNKDSVPWCGLWQQVICARADKPFTQNYLSALAWASFGEPVQWRGKEGPRLNVILLGDIAVFSREGGGHVGTIIGVTKDGKYLWILGGNQQNAVNISMKPITRLYAVRRPKYNIRPAGATHLRLASSGAVSNVEH